MGRGRGRGEGGGGGGGGAIILRGFSDLHPWDILNLGFFKRDFLESPW